MYQHILVATDGEKLSDKAVAAAIGLAAALGAKLTAFHATGEFPVTPFPEYAMLAEKFTPDEWKAAEEKRAHSLLRRVVAKAQKAGVACEGRFTEAAHPYEAILHAAKKFRCDLVVMASHGRHGIRGIVLGSETNKVLTHGKRPVLVIR